MLEQDRMVKQTKDRFNNNFFFKRTAGGLKNNPKTPKFYVTPNIINKIILEDHSEKFGWVSQIRNFGFFDHHSIPW